MKKLFIATLFCLLLGVSLSAQNQQVKMQGGKMTLDQVFRQIESQTGMSVDFDAREIDTARKANVSAGTSTVKALLDSVLEGTGYGYTIRDSHIIINVKEQAGKQDQMISGKVVDTKGEPIPGVGVVQKGTSNGTVTGMDGRFTLDAGSNAVLVFTSLGYKSLEVPVGKRTFLNVTMEDDALFIEDAVVVGYGVQKKENLTGAVSVVSSKSIENRSSANLGSILQGTVPGLTVTTPSGRPGSSVDINIRGWNSINSGSPLVLVDGVVGSLDRVNPNDVESISVLKDASSAGV